MTLLHRPVVKDTAQQLETALAVADGASEYLVQVTRTAADNAAAEVLAGETLQEIMAGRLEMAPGSALDTLSQAVQAAQQFPNLQVRPRSQKKNVLAKFSMILTGASYAGSPELDLQAFA